MSGLTEDNWVDNFCVQPVSIHTLCGNLWQTTLEIDERTRIENANSDLLSGKLFWPRKGLREPHGYSGPT